MIFCTLLKIKHKLNNPENSQVEYSGFFFISGFYRGRRLLCFNTFYLLVYLLFSLIENIQLFLYDSFRFFRKMLLGKRLQVYLKLRGEFVHIQGQHIFQDKLPFEEPVLPVRDPAYDLLPVFIGQAFLVCFRNAKKGKMLFIDIPQHEEQENLFFQHRKYTFQLYYTIYSTILIK